MSQTLKRLPNGWQLFRGSLRDYRANPWRYIMLVGVVTVPSALITMSPTLAADASVASAIGLAQLFMTVALFWAVVHFRGKPMKLRQAYYDGSAAVMRFIVVTMVLALILVPAAVGVSIFALGQSPGSSNGVVEQLLLGFITLLLSSPTFYWLVRFGMSIYRVVASDAWPIAALSYSRELTIGRFWPVTGRILLLLVWMLLLIIVPTVVLIGLAILTKLVIFIGLFNIVVNITLLPVVYLYLYRLYQALEES